MTLGWIDAAVRPFGTSIWIVSIDGRVRRCASQDGRALHYRLETPLPSERLPLSQR